MADGNKTEKPTPRKRQKAREQGQVARSRDLMAGVATITAVLAVAAQAASFPARWRAFFSQTVGASLEGDLVSTSLLFSCGSMVAQTTGLTIALCWAACMAAAFAQGGLVLAPTLLQPQLSRLSPATRVKQLFSLPAMGRLLKSLLPVAVLVYLAVQLLSRDWRAMLGAGRLTVHGMASFALGHVFEVAWKSALVLLVWSGADYFFERQRLEGELRMSRQDLMDEFKETEGHPTIKGRVRRLQRQMRRRRMLEEVKRASVVITNPTEYAIALEYRPGLAAPTVVAKGRNLFARQIKEIARWQGIPMVENVPLAHALYRAVEVGQSIPPKLYAAVAGILAAIYRAQERAAQTSQKEGR